MASSLKPVIALFHGAFFNPVHYRRLIAPLRARGFVVVAPALPSTGLDDSAAGRTYVDDAARVLSYLAPHLDAGREAVVVGHSQGGIAASAVAEGQTVADRRARGLPGGVRALVYLTALAVPNKGDSLLSLMGGTPPPIYKAEGPFYVLTDYAFSAEAPDMQIPESERVPLSKTLAHQSKASIEAPVHFTAADVAVPKTYIVGTEDPSLPPELQEGLARSTGCRVVKIKAGHFPFLESEDKANQVVDIIADVATEEKGGNRSDRAVVAAGLVTN
ncbi:alpha/beta-hydrolase [Hypoxylon sp. FL1284]|nr:alpha/beta-hydrolase [Hypoxylon sp. FL1284]